jgi:hypothetical protein
MSVIPKIPRASGGKPPWAPYQGSTLDQLGTLSGPQTPRLLTPPPPLTTNPGSAPGIGSCKTNYHTITAKTVPNLIYKVVYHNKKYIFKLPSW